MPNYNLYVGRSRYYDPTEFQTLREDLKNMTDQYNTTMAAYGEMSSKADLFEKLANDVKGKDSVAYQNYMNYANAIRQHTDLLATQGLTPSTMRNLVQAKNDYNRIIAPIEEAYNAREAEAKRQAEYMANHPSAIFERDANKMGIDQWMKNPSYRAKSLDRETVANRAKERFAALQKKIQEFVSEHGHVDPSTMDANQLKQWVQTNIPYEYQALEKYGVSPDDVRELMLGNPRMQNSILQAIVNDTMGMYGVDTWNTDYDHYTDAQNQQNRFNIYNQVYNSIRGEAPNAIGHDKYDKDVDNITWQERLKWAELAERKRQFDLDLQYKKDKDRAAGNEKDPKKSKITTSATDFQTEDGKLVSGEKLREFLLAKMASDEETFGTDQITDSQLKSAFEELGISDDQIPDLIQNGYFDDPEKLKAIKNIAKAKEPITRGQAGWAGLKSIGQFLYQFSPFGVTHTAITKAHNLLVNGEEEKWDYPLEWAAANSKIVEAYNIVDPSQNSKMQVYNTYKSKGIDEAWKEFHDNPLIYEGDIKTKDQLKSYMEENDKLYQTAVENLAKEGVISSTKTAKSELQGYINQYKDTGLSNGYLIKNMINGKIWNKPQVKSDLAGGTKKAVIEGVGDIISGTSDGDGKVSVYKYNPKTGVVSNEKEDGEDISNLLKEASSTGRFIIQSVSKDPKKSNIMNVKITMGPKNETYVFPVSNWNEDRIEFVNACLQEADKWEKIANPANVRLRTNVVGRELMTLISQGNTDKTLEEYEQECVRKGLITQKDVMNKTKDYFDAIIQMAGFARAKSLKESALIEMIETSINRSNDPESLVEDEGLENPIRVTPVIYQ